MFTITIYIKGFAMSISKREHMLELLHTQDKWDYTPSAFFCHFGPAFKEGKAAVHRHLAYYHATDMDFMKIQFEHSFPPLDSIKEPKDWLKMPTYGKDFYKNALEVIKGVVQAIDKEALVLATVYSPFMCAGHTVGDELLLSHIAENSEFVAIGMQRITESLKIYIQECIALGVDGFYVSTQGGEAGRFEDAETFEHIVKPYDLQIMEEANKSSCTILHICDYTLKYDRLQQFVEYPSTIVNTSLELVGSSITLQELYTLFDRPVMGGMNRHQAITKGTSEQVLQEAHEALEQAPKRFILGADCTVKADENRVKVAVEAAHAFGSIN
ncbi:MAG: hypothetical protein EOM15_09240 [Spirochaetia bacterium]|nr:hypothetical protein [Spirochaetia bacterium]